MKATLRDRLIRHLGGVTEEDHELECRQAMAAGRFEVSMQNFLRQAEMHFALRKIRAGMDVDVELATHREAPKRTH